MREHRTGDAEENQEDNGRRRQTHENGGETHRVAVVETRAASIEARQREANMADEPCVGFRTITVNPLISAKTLLRWI